jgi:hypothetical protein
MTLSVNTVGSAKNLAASGVICGGAAMARTYDGSIGATAASSVAETTSLQGGISGFYVNSTSSGVITISAGTASGGTALTGSITPAIGWYGLALVGPTGLYFNLSSGSINVTFSVV